MNVLIIRNFPNYMEVKDACYNIQEVGLAKALVRGGNNCDIVFWTDKEERTQEIKVDETGTVKVFYRKGLNILKNCWYKDLDNLISKYDVIQPCEYNQIQSVYFARKYPEKTVIYHGSYYAEFNKRFNMICSVFDLFFLREYIKHETKFMVKSQLAKDFLVSKEIQEGNVAVVGVGIDEDALSTKEETCEDLIYRKICEVTEGPKLLYIGKIEPRRNVLFLIDVFEKVHRDNPKARLYLIGTGEENYVNKVIDSITEKKLENVVVWQRRLQQRYMSLIYKQADFFLLPSEYEIFGMVMLEAMFYETVVLTTENGGSSTLITNNENGFVLKSLSVETWAETITKSFLNKEAMEEMTCKASKKIKYEYTWDRLCPLFIQEYRKCIGTQNEDFNDK